MARYVLDTNVFLDSFERYYRPGTFPGVLDWLKLAAGTGAVCSIPQVRDEIRSTDIKETLDAFPGSLFLEFDGKSDQQLMKINDWVRNVDQFTDNAIQRFLSGADPSVIAFAKANGLTVVTAEVSNPNSRRKVRIPDVCAAFGVPVMNLPDMLERESARFLLDDAIRRDLSDKQLGSSLLM